MRGALIGTLAGSIAGGMLAKKVWIEKYHAQTAELAEAERERDVLYSWLSVKEKGRSLTDYFDEHHLKRVAVLGMNRLGRLAIDELGERAVYGIEAENFAAVHERLTVYRLGEDELPEADCVLVCDLKYAGSGKDARPLLCGETISLAEALRHWT